MDAGFVIVSAVFAAGFLLGYALRAWISARRRRRHMF
jgi:hypothetical protein